jgi:hypothetical protein
MVKNLRWLICFALVASLILGAGQAMAAKVLQTGGAGPVHRPFG